jgi:hypothetical protein
VNNLAVVFVGVETVPWFQDLFSKEILAALLGAFVGGVMTYWATAQAEKFKQRKLELSLCSLLMTEVMGHLVSAELALDKVLPHWLERKGKTYSRSYTIGEISRAASKIYEQFFGTFAGSDPGPFIIQHYNKTAAYNYYMSLEPSVVPAENLNDYVRTLTLFLEGGIKLVDRLRAMKGMHRWMKKEFRHDLELFDEHRRRRLLMAALYRTDARELQKLFDKQPLDSHMPEILAKASPNNIRPWFSWQP